MKTERRSFIVAASPGSLGDDVDRHAERLEALGEGGAAGPDASAGVASPFAGTGPSRATSAKRSAPTTPATSRFSAGAAVFRSA